MSVTIKNVLDRFATEPTLQTFSGLYRSTDRFQCPLAVFFNEVCVSSFVMKAKQAGLSTSDIDRIMTWADTGRWSIFTF